MQIDKKLLLELRNATFAGFADCRDALVATGGDFDKAVKWLKEKGKIKAAKKRGAIAADGIVKFLGDTDAIGALIEVNSQTDFVAKNDQFVSLVDGLLDSILKLRPNTVEEFSNTKIDDSGLSVDEKLTEATAKLGEKISIRRFEIMQSDSDGFVGGYTHANKRIAAIALFKGKKPDDEIVKKIMMNIVANNPVAVDKDHLDPKWVENEFEIIKKKTIEEGKPANMAENIAKGRLNKQLEEVSLADQVLITDPNLKVGELMKQNNLEIVKFVRYEVGEGIQKNETNFVDEVNAQIGK